MSRSKMIHNIICLLEEGAISLEGFSEELRERVKFAGGRK